MAAALAAHAPTTTDAEGVPATALRATPIYPGVIGFVIVLLLLMLLVAEPSGSLAEFLFFGPLLVALALLQPTEPKKVLLAPKGDSNSSTLKQALLKRDGTSRPEAITRESLRAYILNTALAQNEPNGQRVQAPNRVDFMDLADLSYEARVDIDQSSDGFYEPQDMALTNDGQTLAVVSRGADPEFFPQRNPPPHLTIIDTESARVLRRIPLAASDWPRALALSPDGRLAYVSSPQKSDRSIDGAAVVVVDLENNRVEDRIPLFFEGGSGPGEIVITPDGALLFVLNALEFQSAASRPGIVVIDTRTRTQVTTIGGAGDINTARAISEMTQLAIHPTGATIYVADVRTPQSATDFETVGLGVIDVPTATLTRLVPIPGARNAGIDDLQVSADGRAITHADGVTGTTTVLDATTLEILYQTDIGDAVLTAIGVGP
jgi:DNA-binding beta-propeller fold protein YncE